MALLKSCLCQQRQLESPEFRRWFEPMFDVFQYHRKLWEFAYIAQALSERGMLQHGKKGLGFAVGREPLAALFASMGCEVVATDLHQEKAASLGWVESGQHADSLEILNDRGICNPDLFRQRVSFRPVDMNHIPADLVGFDFCWSSCSFEHLGSIELGKQFVLNMTRCLKPRGIAVHTTEFNVSSNDATIDDDPRAVLFRRKDIEEIAAGLRAGGHHIDVDFQPGDGEIDQIIDQPPWREAPEEVRHLKLWIGEFVSTSIGLIIETR
jgi:hypothetical protein